MPPKAGRASATGLGTMASIVVSHVSFPASTSFAITTAVIAFVSDPRCHRSSGIALTSVPAFRTPVTAIVFNPWLVTMAPPSAGR